MSCCLPSFLGALASAFDVALEDGLACLPKTCSRQIIVASSNVRNAFRSVFPRQCVKNLLVMESAKLASHCCQIFPVNTCVLMSWRCLEIRSSQVSVMPTYSWHFSFSSIFGSFEYINTRNVRTLTHYHISDHQFRVRGDSFRLFHGRVRTVDRYFGSVYLPVIFHWPITMIHWQRK